MPMPGEIGAQGDLARFRRLVNITILATFALIVLGGIVRVSDSGLGCGPAGSGTHGWPLCNGRGVPILEGATLIEFSHRIAAATVGILVADVARRQGQEARRRDDPAVGDEHEATPVVDAASGAVEAVGEAVPRARAGPSAPLRPGHAGGR